MEARGETKFTFKISCLQNVKEKVKKDPKRQRRRGGDTMLETGKDSESWRDRDRKEETERHREMTERTETKRH